MGQDLRRTETDSTVEGCGKLLLACAREIDRLIFCGEKFVKERPEKAKESGSSWLEICERKN